MHMSFGQRPFAEARGRFCWQVRKLTDDTSWYPCHYQRFSSDDTYAYAIITFIDDDDRVHAAIAATEHEGERYLHSWHDGWAWTPVWMPDEADDAILDVSVGNAGTAFDTLLARARRYANADFEGLEWDDDDIEGVEDGSDDCREPHDDAVDDDGKRNVDTGVSIVATSPDDKPDGKPDDKPDDRGDWVRAWPVTRVVAPTPPDPPEPSSPPEPPCGPCFDREAGRHRFAFAVMVMARLDLRNVTLSVPIVEDDGDVIAACCAFDTCRGRLVAFLGHGVSDDGLTPNAWEPVEGTTRSVVPDDVRVERIRKTPEYLFDAAPNEALPASWMFDHLWRLLPA